MELGTENLTKNQFKRLNDLFYFFCFPLKIHELVSWLVVMVMVMKLNQYPERCVHLLEAYLRWWRWKCLISHCFIVLNFCFTLNAFDWIENKLLKCFIFSILFTSFRSRHNHISKKEKKKHRIKREWHLFMPIIILPFKIAKACQTKVFFQHLPKWC